MSTMVGVFVQQRAVRYVYQQINIIVGGQFASTVM